MKKFLRFIVITLLLVIITPIIFAGAMYIFTPEMEIDEEKFNKTSLSVEMFDGEGKEIENVAIKGETADISTLPPHVKNAFIAVEDRRFYTHNGVDLRGIMRAFKNNLMSGKMKEGGSTITQQLIKNTHLTGEKTLKRKIKEIKLAKKLEKTHSKDEILGYYLNGIYFGNGLYGIESASKKYFGKKAEDLSINQAASLAGTVKAPSFYNPLKKKCNERKNVVLELMLRENYISEEEYQKNIKMPVLPLKDNQNSNYISKIMETAFEKADISPYENTKLSVFTYLDKRAQKILENDLEKVSGGGIIMSSKGKVKGYYMPFGDIKRSPASTIKPLLVYAPAIEENLISLATPLLDEKCDFGNWIPENYGDKYNGWISVENALSKSLNIPAIKTLESLGIEKAIKYGNKMGMEISEGDLSMALGNIKGGLSLVTLAGGYTALSNCGNFSEPSFIKSISANGRKIYEDNNEEKTVFSPSTAELVSHALSTCAKEGTAKAIGQRSYPICAKTGTSGNKKGNTDALTIAYSSTDIFGVWLGNPDNSLMPNDITGGVASRYVAGILNEFYKDKTPPDFKKSGETEMVKLCKFAYDDLKLQLASEFQPDRYTFSSLMKKEVAENLEKSSYFAPLIKDYEVVTDKNTINIMVDKCNHVSYEIILKGKKENNIISSTKENSFTFSINDDGIYSIVLRPFTEGKDGNIIYGDDVLLPLVKIDLKDEFINGNWWEN